MGKNSSLKETVSFSPSDLEVIRSIAKNGIQKEVEKVIQQLRKEITALHRKEAKDRQTETKRLQKYVHGLYEELRSEFGDVWTNIYNIESEIKFPAVFGAAKGK